MDESACDDKRRLYSLLYALDDDVLEQHSRAVLQVSVHPYVTLEGTAVSIFPGLSVSIMPAYLAVIDKVLVYVAFIRGGGDSLTGDLPYGYRQRVVCMLVVTIRTVFLLGQELYEGDMGRHFEKLAKSRS